VKVGSQKVGLTGPIAALVFFALFDLRAWSNQSGIHLFIAPTVLLVWLMGFLGLSAQAVIFLRLRCLAISAILTCPQFAYCAPIRLLS